MHPLFIILIVTGVPLAVYLGFELYDSYTERQQQRQEQKKYEDYVRNYREKASTIYSEHKHDQSDDDDNVDDDDDDEPLANTTWKREFDGLRQRHSASMISESSDELYEMRKSIIERKRQLERDQAMLDLAERELDIRRDSLKFRGNNILGIQPEQDSLGDKDRLTRSASRESCQTIRPMLCQPEDNPFDDPDWLSEKQHSPAMSDHTFSLQEMVDIPIAPLAMPALVISPAIDSPIDTQWASINTTLQFPILNSDTEDSWADLDRLGHEHHRVESGGSDLTFNSFDHSGTPSYGVRSVSSEDYMH